MSITDLAKWSCPACRQTVTATAIHPDDSHAAIVAVQKLHARRHKADVLAELAALRAVHAARETARQKATA